MSSRNFRKYCGGSLPPPDSDDSDGEYNPLANRHQKKSTYEGLELTSGSDTDVQPEVVVEEKEEKPQETESVAHGGARKKKLKGKGKGKGKGKKSKVSVRDNAANNPSAGTSGAAEARQRQPLQQADELDEIDKSIMEVNALLGAPPPAPVQTEVSSNQEEKGGILSVQAKYLNVANEIKRLFGPDTADDIRARTKSQPYRTRLLKRVMIPPFSDTYIYDFKKTGLSMSILKREDNITHFVYDHDKDHQKMHHAFLQRYTRNLARHGTSLLQIEEAKKNMHVEPLLEIADTWFRMDEHGLANELIENIVAYLQYVAHPSFNLASSNVRLWYTYIENRPFHVAMLKYMYLLTNKACHRTALEIAKMLLNIDPSDPLAVLFIIDTVALRAREHQWLIDAIDYFTKQRQANLLFNIQYSLALAHFHIAFKQKKEFTEASKLLKIAILSYPQVVVKILEYCNRKDPKIQNHVLFKNEPNSMGEGLSELIMIYARLTWPRWRTPEVMEWFVRNVNEVSENYNNSAEVRIIKQWLPPRLFRQIDIHNELCLYAINSNTYERILMRFSQIDREQALQLSGVRQNVFQAWPSEIMRHVSVIRSMADLLMEVTLTSSRRPTSGWDPLFERGINRYSYSAPSDPQRNIPQGSRALLYRFFTSIVPGTELEPPVDD